MDKPQKAFFNQNRETSTLKFKHERNALDGEYFMRGGVCWPEGMAQGFAIVAGKNINTKSVYIFEQSNFLSIDNIVGPGQIIEYQGSCTFFNNGWSRYFCRKYFYKQDKQTHRRFYLDVIRSSMVQPKPGFIEAPYTNEEDADHLIFTCLSMGKLVLDKESDLSNQLGVFRNDNKTKLPAVRALRALLVGFERFPFRAYDVEEGYR